jgi:hypothetical protein
MAFGKVPCGHCVQVAVLSLSWVSQPLPTLPYPTWTPEDGAVSARAALGAKYPPRGS